MGFENSPSLATLIVLILLSTLTVLSILASIYFYCCHRPKRIPTLRRQSYSLSMKAKNDPDTSTNIKFLDPPETMNRSISFEVRNTRSISSSPNFDECVVRPSLRGGVGIGAEPRPELAPRFLPNWRRLVHVESTVRLPLTGGGVDRDVSLTGLEETSLESMLRKFDALVLSFRWAEPTTPRGEDVFSCRSSVSTSSFLSLHWGRLSETDVFKSISSEYPEDIEDSHTDNM